MIERQFFFKNSSYIPIALDLISMTIPCFLDTEFVEMDFCLIKVKLFKDDLEFVNGVFSILFE